MKDKFGSYINKLMVTIIDGDADEFAKQLAWQELQRIKEDIKSFLAKHVIEDVVDVENGEKTQKVLLQENKND